MRLRWAVASERKISSVYMGSTEVILRSWRKGVFSMYIISRIKTSFLGVFFSSPETDHSHVRFNSTEL